MVDDLGVRIARRIKALRVENGWSLEELAERSGVSRSTLSRLENGETSPTTDALARIAAAFSLTLTRIVHLAEETFTAHVPRAAQPLYEDARLGFSRRSISPPAPGLKAEMIECRIEPGQVIAYDFPLASRLEHHLFLIEGTLELTTDGTTYHLAAGDCLRFVLSGNSRFSTLPETGAHYILTMVPWP